MHPSSPARLAALLLVLTAVTAPAAGTTAIGEKKPKEFGALEYRLIGPSVGGRMTAVAGVPGNPLVFYASAAQGGLWKSEDGGREWRSLFDEEATQSIGSFAIAPSDPNIIYVGSGEANTRGNVAIGLGIWKSLDAGETWQQVWKTHGQIGQMIVHPTNPDIAFAAVLGSPFGPSETRGVYRTRDGGKTFKSLKKGLPQKHAYDLVFRHGLAIDETGEKLAMGSTTGGVWVSEDQGDSWQNVSHSLPPVYAVRFA